MQGLIGGAAGLVIGLAGIWVLNVIAPTLGGSATTGTMPGGGPVMAGPGATDGATAAGPFGDRLADAAGATTEVVLNAPVTISVVAIAIALAVLGGLLAGAIGGWRASRLRPAEALRSVA